MASPLPCCLVFPQVPLLGLFEVVLYKFVNIFTIADSVLAVCSIHFATKYSRCVHFMPPFYAAGPF